MLLASSFGTTIRKTIAKFSSTYEKLWEKLQLPTLPIVNKTIETKKKKRKSKVKKVLQGDISTEYFEAFALAFLVKSSSIASLSLLLSELGLQCAKSKEKILYALKKHFSGGDDEQSGDGAAPAQTLQQEEPSQAPVILSTSPVDQKKARKKRQKEVQSTSNTVIDISSDEEKPDALKPTAAKKQRKLPHNAKN